jgi:tripartite-type tricarboxylate transporter receptor subunit TctC
MRRFRVYVTVRRDVARELLMKPVSFSVIRAVVAQTSLMIITLLVMCIAAPARADDYPARPIRLIVPFAAGGPNDIVARIMATELGKSLGQNVITENRPGASGNIAAELAAHAAPDDYTLFWAQGATHGANPWLYGADIKYDPEKDFVPIALIGRAPIVVLTAPGSGIKSLDDLLRKAKVAPDKLTFASGGHGTTPHMAGELLKASAGVKLVHIPYKGS